MASPMNSLFEFRNNKYNIKNFSTDLPSEYKLAASLEEFKMKLFKK